MMVGIVLLRAQPKWRGKFMPWEEVIVEFLTLR